MVSVSVPFTGVIRNTRLSSRGRKWCGGPPDLEKDTDVYRSPSLYVWAVIWYESPREFVADVSFHGNPDLVRGFDNETFLRLKTKKDQTFNTPPDKNIRVTLNSDDLKIIIKWSIMV